MSEKELFFNKFENTEDKSNKLINYLSSKSTFSFSLSLIVLGIFAAVVGFAIGNDLSLYYVYMNAIDGSTTMGVLFLQSIVYSFTFGILLLLMHLSAKRRNSHLVIGLFTLMQFAFVLLLVSSYVLLTLSIVWFHEPWLVFVLMNFIVVLLNSILTYKLVKFISNLKVKFNEGGNYFPSIDSSRKYFFINLVFVLYQIYYFVTDIKLPPLFETQESYVSSFYGPWHHTLERNIASFGWPMFIPSIIYFFLLLFVMAKLYRFISNYETNCFQKKSLKGNQK